MLLRMTEYGANSFLFIFIFYFSGTHFFLVKCLNVLCSIAQLPNIESSTSSYSKQLNNTLQFNNLKMIYPEYIYSPSIYIHLLILKNKKKKSEL